MIRCLISHFSNLTRSSLPKIDTIPGNTVERLEATAETDLKKMLCLDTTALMSTGEWLRIGDGDTIDVDVTALLMTHAGPGTSSTTATVGRVLGSSNAPSLSFLATTCPQ